MSWYFLVPCVAAAGFSLLPIERFELGDRQPSCVDVSCLGCSGSSSSWSSLPCVSIVVDSVGYNQQNGGSFALASGLCLPKGNRCVPSPCTFTFDVAITIVNGCSGPVYYLSRHNGSCLPGVTKINAGESGETVKYNEGEEIVCGNAYDHFVYLSDPSPVCAPGSAVAGWSLTCSSCQGVGLP